MTINANLPEHLPASQQRPPTKLPDGWEQQRPTGRTSNRRAPDDGPKPASFTDPTPFPGMTWAMDTFCRVYTQTADELTAFEAAGYAGRLANSNSMNVRIARLKGHPKVKAAMVHWSRIAASTYNASRESVLAQLVRFGWVDPADYVDENGLPLPLHKLPRDVRMAIQDFDVVQTDIGPVHRYRFVPKLKSIELLAKVATLLDPAAAGLRKATKGTRVRLRFDGGGEATVETVEG